MVDPDEANQMCALFTYQDGNQVEDEMYLLNKRSILVGSNTDLCNFPLDQEEGVCEQHAVICFRVKYSKRHLSGEEQRLRGDFTTTE